MRRIIVIAGLVVLAACRPAPSENVTAPALSAAPASAAPAAPVSEAVPAPDAAPAAKAPADKWSSPMALTGTEPFWALLMRGDRLTFTRPDAPVVALSATRVDAAMGAKWTASGQGQAITVSVREAKCSDGMSERSYPYTAEVTLNGEVLKGCGAPAG